MKVKKMNLTLVLIFLSLALFDSSKSNLNQVKVKNTFLKLNDNYFKLDNSYLLISFESSSKIYCLTSCGKYTECFYTIIQDNKCFLCKKNLTYFMTYQSDGISSIYQKQYKKTSGLINYWTFNKNVKHF
jgi:hypothetical protein